MADPVVVKKQNRPSQQRQQPVVVFHALGTAPDVRLQVFDREFHLHSTVLKLHSEFFLKFLDAAGGKSPETKAQVGRRFRYEWVARIDPYGKAWHLVAADAKVEPLPDLIEVNERVESVCFGKLLRAIYGERYVIDSANQLTKMTNQAEYYRALPALSRTLDGALAHSGHLLAEMPSACCVLLICASKLRNALLFRESMVWAVSAFHHPKYAQDGTLRRSHRAIFHVLDGVHDEIALKIARLLTDITMACLAHSDEATRQARQNVVRDAAAEYPIAGLDAMDMDTDTDIDTDQDLATRLPRYFRKLHNDACFHAVCGDELDAILRNELVFNHRDVQAGVGDANKGLFFCATVGDEDLPWDATQNRSCGD